MMRNSESFQILSAPTGGFNRSRCPRIQRCRLNALRGSAMSFSSLLAGDCEYALDEWALRLRVRLPVGAVHVRQASLERGVLRRRPRVGPQVVAKDNAFCPERAPKRHEV